MESSHSLNQVIDGPLPIDYAVFGERSEAQAFGRQRIAPMVALTLLTLTAYMPYWLYTRSRALCGIRRGAIPSAVVHGALAAYALAFVCNLGQLAVPYSDAQRLLLAAVSLTANSGLLVWTLLLRQGLIDEVLHRHPRPSVNVVLTVFFSIFYLQSKINQAQDAE